jgi:hypothetical protein
VGSSYTDGCFVVGAAVFAGGVTISAGSSLGDEVSSGVFDSGGVDGVDGAETDASLGDAALAGAFKSFTDSPTETFEAGSSAARAALATERTRTARVRAMFFMMGLSPDVEIDRRLRVQNR